MIIERSILNILTLQQYAPDTKQWETWTGDLQALSITRGGKRNGVTVTNDPGTLEARFLSRGDAESRWEWGPNSLVRVGLPTSKGVVPIYTGRVADVARTTVFNKQDGTEVDHITISAVDAVASHAAITRYGAISDPETFAQRIRRLADSAVTPLELPADDSPRKVYEL